VDVRALTSGRGKGRPSDSHEDVKGKLSAERKARSRHLSDLVSIVKDLETTCDNNEKTISRRETTISNLKRFCEMAGLEVPPSVLKTTSWEPTTVEKDYLRQRSQSSPPAPGSRSRSVSTTPLDYTPSPLDTPRSRVKKEILSYGIKPSSIPLGLRRKLQAANAVMDALAKCKRGDLDQKKIVLSIISSSPVHKARAVSALKPLGISRQTIIRNRGKTIKEKLSKRLSNKEKTDEHREKIGAFMERDDNSRMTADRKLKYKYDDGRVVQKRVLTDFSRPLHKKFLSEHPECVVGITTFRFYKPKHIAWSKELRKRSCLCQKCENMRLLLLKLSLLTAERVPLSPYEFAKMYDDGEAVENLVKTVKSDKPNNTVTYKQWKKTTVEVFSWEFEGTGSNRRRVKKPKTVERTIPTNVTETLHSFKNTTKHMVCEWREHEERYSHQFNSMRNLRENMPSNHIEIQIDFSENFTCEVQAGEVQSGYWNTPQVTISPVVVRYKPHDAAPTESKTFIYCSEIDKHNSEMIWAILNQFWSKDFPAAFGQDFVEKIEVVHYVSDSPFSQYRNRFIFFIISQHNRLFRKRAIWNYLEAGHGKGACDGAGSGVKRKVTMAAKHGWMICDFQSFWEFLCSVTESVMTFLKIDPDDYLDAMNDIGFLREMSMRELGIATLAHAISVGKSGSPYSIIWRHLSCTCESCLDLDFDNCCGPTDGCAWESKPLFWKNRTVSEGLRRRLKCGRCQVFCTCPERFH